MITLDMLMQDVEATRLSYSPLVEIAISYHALTAYNTVIAPNSQQEFWLADAALQASLIGRPADVAVGMNPAAPASAGSAH